MKRLLVFYAVIIVFAFIKGKNLEKSNGLTQQQTIEELKKEVKELKKTIAEMENGKSLVVSR
jgi:hypothetical protein